MTCPHWGRVGWRWGGPTRTRRRWTRSRPWTCCISNCKKRCFEKYFKKYHKQHVTISSPSKPNLLSWLLVGEDDDEEDDVGEDGEEAVDEHDHPDRWLALVLLHVIHPGGTVHGSWKAYRGNRCSFHLFEFTSHFHPLSISSLSEIRSSGGKTTVWWRKKITISSWLNCMLRGVESVYWVSLGQQWSDVLGGTELIY